MSPRTDEQYQAIRKEKKELILQTAMEMFAGEGYHATTINSIASKAKISKGLVYNYFSSKQELLKEIIHSGFNNLVKMYEGIDKIEDPHKKISTLSSRTVEMMLEKREYWKLYFLLLMQPQIMESFYEDLVEISEPYIKTHVDIFREMGYEDPETEALFYGMMLDGFSLNVLVNPLMSPEGPFFEKIKKRMLNSYKDGKNI